MYLLNEKKLKKGDIVLLKFETEKSKLIRRYSNSQFSHAMIYVGEYSLIDADGPGVHAHNLQRLLIPKEDDVVILRSKNTSLDQLLKVEQFVRSKVGTKYSMEEARKVVRNKELVPEDNRQFCTRLVAKAFEFAGLNIVENPDFCSPKDIEDSKELSVIQGATRAAREEEIEYVNETDTPLEKQAEVTNKIFEEIRVFTVHDIQTFEQLDEFLLNHPEHDIEFTRIITESGYLKLWEADTRKNPWYYDFDAFTDHYPETQYASMGKWLIDLCKGLFFRFKPMHEYYKEKTMQANHEYFKVMLELYEKLLELNSKRMEVGIDAMIEAGLTEEEIMSFVQP
jgi:Permuted papain-like amidase enzyme, YaeF/YiiX, C92 family